MHSDSDRVEEKYPFPSSRVTGTDLCLKENILNLVIPKKDEVKPSNKIVWQKDWERYRLTRWKRKIQILTFLGRLA